MRLLAWNIRHGGGSRLAPIVASVSRRRPDVVVLSEYRRKTAADLRKMLAAAGLPHATDALPPAGCNGVLIAARRPFRQRGPLSCRLEQPYRMIDVELPGLQLTGVYMPNLLRKVPYWEAVLRAARRRRRGRAVFLGDFNTTRHFLDEAGAVCLTSGYMDRIEAAGFCDVWRRRWPAARVYSWYSHRGNGYRLDHAFCSEPLAEDIPGVFYSHAERRRGLSDHSMLIVDLPEG